MPLWKRRMFSRLMKPQADDGADTGTGGGASSDTGASAAPASDTTPSASEPTPASDTPPSEAPPADAVAKTGSKMAAFLDSLTDDPNAAKPAEAPPVAATAEKKPAVGEQAAVPPVVPKVDDKAKAPDQEEAELLEGVKSDRGKERIKQVFAEKKQLEQDVNEFREMVRSTGMSPQEFAQTLEFGRLLNSGDEKNLRVALEMVEGQRAMLYQKLGQEAPGVDLLKGHDDLKKAVDSMEITRDRAVELAKFRKQQQEAQQRQQAQQQSQQEQQAFNQQVQQAAQSMEAYLQTRANEVDHPARMKVITEHFKNPANLQAFVSTYTPQQWAATVKMMYDNIQVPRAAPSPQPIRSRPAALGTPAPSASAPIDRIAQRMESMGL